MYTCGQACTLASHTICIFHIFFLHSAWKIPWCISHVFSRTWMSCTLVSYIRDLLTIISSNQVIRYIFRNSSAGAVGCQTLRWSSEQLYGARFDCLKAACLSQLTERKINGNELHISDAKTWYHSRSVRGNTETHCFNENSRYPHVIQFAVFIFGLPIVLIAMCPKFSSKTHSQPVKAEGPLLSLVLLEVSA